MCLIKTMKNLIILFILLQRWVLTTSNMDQIRVEEFNPQATIYIEMLGEVEIHHGTWSFITNIEFKHLNSEVQFLEGQLQRLHTICEKEFTCRNEKQIKSQPNNVDSLKDYVNHLYELIGYKIRRKSNNKTDGEYKIFSGTLTPSDASYYNKEIDKLREKNLETADVWENQTTLILNQHRKNRENLEKTNDRISYLHKLQKVKLNQEIFEILSQCMQTYNDLMGDVTNLIEIVKNGKVKLSSSQILPLHKVFAVLQGIAAQQDIPRLEESDFATLISISEFTMALNFNELICVLKVPLIGLYNVIHPIPLPVYSVTKGYAVYPMNMDYLLLNRKREKFIPITQEEYHKLKDINETKLLKKPHPEYQVETSNDCVINLIVRNKNKECETKYFKTKYFLSIESSISQNLIVLPIHEEPIRIECNEKKSRTIKITKRSILHLPWGCKVLNKYQLIARTTQEITITNTTTIGYLSETFLKRLLAKTKIQQQELVLPIVEENTITYQNISNFGLSAKGLYEQIQQIAERKASEIRSSKMIIVGVALSFVYLVFWSGVFSFGLVCKQTFCTDQQVHTRDDEIVSQPSVDVTCEEIQLIANSD